MLTPAGLTNILEKYAQIVEVEGSRTGRKRRGRRSVRATISSVLCAAPLADVGCSWRGQAAT